MSAAERSHSEEQQRHDFNGNSERLLRAIVENIPDMIFVKDATQLKFVLFNRAGERLLGIPREELLGKSDHDLFPAAQSDFFVSKDREVLLNGTPVEIPEERILTRSQGERLLRTTKIPIFDDWGRPAYLLGISEDITALRAAEADRLRSQRALEESEARFRKLTEASFDAIVISQDGVILEINPGVTDMLGYSMNEVIGRPLTDFVAEESLDTAQRRIAEETEGRFDLVARHKDGSRLYLESTSRMHVIEGRPMRLTALRDVTENRRLEAQFRQAQKMEALGRLAAGVAHDFNNLLTVIRASSEFLLLDLAPTDPRRQDAIEIQRAGESAQALTRQLLAYSRQQALDPKPLDLNEVVSGLGRMLTRLVGSDVQLVSHLAPKPGTVYADAGQLEQVIMNLAVNARDAMPNGGTLRIETANVEVTPEQAAADLPSRAGPYALLSVSDTGVGFSEDVKARIFEPFFTTKKPGEGTGLGLAAVYGIVKQSDGFIYVDSAPGRGTTFKIYLPRVAGAAESSAPPPEAAGPGGSETILLVEDTPSVRRTLRRALERHGYHVFEASDGEIALSLTQQHGTIQLLLTDLAMPGMSGSELAGHVRELHPEVKVLFMSGSDEAVARQGIAEGQAMFLRKPVSMQALASKVREILDG